MIIRRFNKTRASCFVTIPAEYIHKWGIRDRDYVIFSDSPTGAIILRFITEKELRQFITDGKGVVIDETA